MPEISPNPQQREYVQQTATARLTTFAAFHTLYAQQEPFGSLETPSLSKVDKLVRTLRRIPEDVRDRRKSRTQLEALQTLTVVVTELPRDAFLTNERLQRLAQQEGNREVIAALHKWELGNEQNAETILMIEGLTRAQFHALMGTMGNPFSPVSDPRDENGGRVTIDNKPFNGYPKTSNIMDIEDIKAEQERWDLVIPQLAGLPFFRRIRNSRTHGVVYMIPDAPEAQTQTPPEIRRDQAEAEGKMPSRMLCKGATWRKISSLTPEPFFR